MARQLYDMEFIQKLSEKLRALPEVAPPKKKATKPEVIKVLAGEIENLLQRGYSMEQIADALSGDGFDIAGPVLKSYVSRVRAEADGKTAGRRPGKKKNSVQAQKQNKPEATEEVKAASL